MTQAVNRFAPIAIVGQSCTLPGALSPQALWDNVRAGRDCLSRVAAGRWGMPHELVMAAVGDAADRTWSDVGGYVSGFKFDATGFLLSAEQLHGLDPLFQMTLQGVRTALAEVGLRAGAADLQAAGLVLGNLSFPSTAMARYAQGVWQGEPSDIDPRNRFNSGLPAHIAARALGLGGGAFALDAACASSLYAIKLACDRLQDGSADLMVAGAVNQADDLFIHIGFSALSALSRSGQSRPFHRDADGLVPAEGAGFVVLQRLEDALAAGRPVLGVIRGIGLSNDGRGRGLLAPSEEGQERAIRLAYAQSGLLPNDIGMVECHATGTPVGDATELRSMARVFAGCREIPIGSLKSNLGHLITAAGVAGLLKVLAAMRHGERPPTLHANVPNAALEATPFRLLQSAEPWTGPRRAAVSAFGFGGNNAHLIVEALDEYRAGPGVTVSVPRSAPKQSPEIAIVGIGARVGAGQSLADFRRDLFAGALQSTRCDVIDVALDGLRFPPYDLQQSLAQQTLVLEAAREAAQGMKLPRERTSVLVGMSCDAEVCRYGLRWRLAASITDPAALARARDAVVPVLQAPGVVGAMPNIPANRINSQLDLAGPAFTVSAEEASGIRALELAARALRQGEIDAALVGAVDLSHEAVHSAALGDLGEAPKPGDAAVVLVLKRLDDARRAGDRIYSVIQTQAADAGLDVGDAAPGVNLAPRFGKPHAANGLLHVAAAAVALHHGARPQLGAPAQPWFGARYATVEVKVREAASASVHLASAPDPVPAPWSAEDCARLYVFSGNDRSAAVQALRNKVMDAPGTARIVIVAASDEELTARSTQAERWLRQGGPAPEGVAFRDAPLKGDLAFVFTGAAAAYRGMGRELALALPRQVAALTARCPDMAAATRWAYAGERADADNEKHPLDQLWGASYLCQLHAEITQNLLQLKPTAAIGYSSGETNALFALGAWTDLGAMMQASREGTAFADELVPPFAAPRRHWQRLDVPEAVTLGWANYAIAAPLPEVRAALANEPLVRLTIINTAEDCVIGGEAQACARVVAQLGTQRALPLDYDMVAHCPEVGEIRQAWWNLHHRRVDNPAAVDGIRFYTNATGRWYRPTAESAADAITGQALDTLDFPRTIEQAWADGVRIFVEHGPRGLCSGWIRRILGERENLVVALDQPGRSGVRQMMNAAAWLVAAGVPLDHAALEAELARGTSPNVGPGPVLRLPAHWPAPSVRQFDAEAESTSPLVQRMAPAPYLEPVLHLPHPVASAVATPAAAPVVEPPPIDTTLGRWLAHQAQLSTLHQQFIAQQQATHERFLALQQSAEAMLRQGFAVASGVANGVPGGAATCVAVDLPRALRSLPAHQRIAVPPEPTFADQSAQGTPPPTPALTASAAHPGPKFDRAQLEWLASGKISSVFGPQFAGQDGYARQVRMPQPPLLLADRVTGIDGVPASMGKGTLWTETDILADSWYLDAEGRMPAGIMIESGQADLLLISWLGVDALNRGERVYRLLGCDLSWHGGLPGPGDTLCYDIHVDGHATQGDVRLFFFHYDCRVNGEIRLSVRNGQAGFFSDEELENSAGVLWNPDDEKPAAAPLDPPTVVCTKQSFTPDELAAFAAGRAYDCFGSGWELAQTHVRSPRITSDPMRFLHEVTEFDPHGGPWRRGYLRAETPVTPDDWFFKGHFKNDPCMPGTLMFEGCLQAMAIYLSALGFTLERDAWRFEPVPDTRYPMRCRGQVTPSSRQLVYEVFVSSVRAGPIPTLFADLLCTVDGRKAFHARGVGLQLVPDWPLVHWKTLGPAHTQRSGAPVHLPQLAGLVGYVEPKPVAVVDGFAFDYHALLACAWGPQSAAFGPMYQRFDSHRRAARLPGPPYHFMSRIVRVGGPIGGLQPGTRVEVEYDVPAEQWYFEQNGHPTMPFCVIMEAALQPCGWLASYVGSALTSDTDLLFRNLDGTGTLHREILPAAGTLRTQVTLVSTSQSAGMIIQNFKVACLIGDQPVFDMKTVFGFFPKEAFENQVGLPATPEEMARVTADAETLVDLRARPAKYFSGGLRLPGRMLLMLDRITHYEPTGGAHGLGALRAEKLVRPEEWFFKAHFFQDPVQPGSLGVEALCQLLQFFMLQQELGQGITDARFEPVLLEQPVTWKYRGQVVPRNRVITTEIQVVERGVDVQGPYAIAEGWLWVDGKRIYHARNLGMRIIPAARTGNGQ